MKLLPPADPEEEDAAEHVVQLAVVGRPNVGKSSLVNRLLGKERVMVSNIPGTTRDAIDSRFTAPDGTEYNIIDTAGIRRKRVIEDEMCIRDSFLIGAVRGIQGNGGKGNADFIGDGVHGRLLPGSGLKEGYQGDLHGFTQVAFIVIVPEVVLHLRRGKTTGNDVGSMQFTDCLLYTSGNLCSG